VIVRLSDAKQDAPPNNIETLNLLTQNVENYQQAFDCLVSRITRRLLPSAEATGIESSDSAEVKDPHARIVVNSFHSQVPNPGRFGITSVDPLNFLGIVPTAKNGELLHGCERVCYVILFLVRCVL
jgi:hypothetical protein